MFRRIVLLLVFLGPPSLVAAQAPRALSITKELTLDGEKEQFSQIGQILLRRNQEAVIFAELNNNLIRVYSPEGRQLTTFGRRGAGPGEFRATSPGWLADTLWVGDAASKRITYIGTDNKVLRSEALPLGLKTRAEDREVVPAIGTPVPRVAYPNGDFLYLHLSPVADAKVPWLPKEPDQMALVRTNHLGVVQSRIAVLPMDSPMRCQVNSPQGGGSIPLCGRLFSGITPDGKHIGSVIQDNSVAGGTRSSYRVIALGERGDTAFNRTIPYTAIAIRKTELDSLVADTNRSQVVRELLKKATLPKSYAPLRGMVIGIDGSVWLRTSTGLPAEKESQWLVLDPKGAILGTVTLPPRSRLQTATATSIWVIEMDEDGVESVVRYRVGR